MSYLLRSARNATLFIDGKHVAHTNSRGINTNLDIEAPMFFGKRQQIKLFPKNFEVLRLSRQALEVP